MGGLAPFDQQMDFSRRWDLFDLTLVGGRAGGGLTDFGIFS